MEKAMQVLPQTKNKPMYVKGKFSVKKVILKATPNKIMTAQKMINIDSMKM
jgi:hypothetical protein